MFSVQTPASLLGVLIAIGLIALFVWAGYIFVKNRFPSPPSKKQKDTRHSNGLANDHSEVTNRDRNDDSSDSSPDSDGGGDSGGGNGGD